MLKRLLLLSACLLALVPQLRAGVLIVADEFPAMQYLAGQLKSRAGVESRVVSQTELPPELAGFQAVVVYIHKELVASAEHAFIRYATNGGRLVLLHHSISSGKRSNRDWFPFLGVQLPLGDIDHGGYKWIEGVTVDWVRLTPHSLVTNQVIYPGQVTFPPANGGPPRDLPTFELKGTEVYLNHVLSGPRIPLLGLKFTDVKTGRTWSQPTAGWLRPAGRGSVVYFMPGHTERDFENPVYQQIVLNAITAAPERDR